MTIALYQRLSAPYIRVDSPSPRLAVGRRSFTILRILAAARRRSSCSHTRILVQPASASLQSVSRSRARLARTFSAQKVAFVAAMVWCSGQPCQKQPSMNTATRAELKTMSAVRLTWGSGRADTR